MTLLLITSYLICAILSFLVSRVILIRPPGIAHWMRPYDLEGSILLTTILWPIGVVTFLMMLVFKDVRPAYTIKIKKHRKAKDL